MLISLQRLLLAQYWCVGKKYLHENIYHYFSPFQWNCLQILTKFALNFFFMHNVFNEFLNNSFPHNFNHYFAFIHLFTFTFVWNCCVRKYYSCVSQEDWSVLLLFLYFGQLSPQVLSLLSCLLLSSQICNVDIIRSVYIVDKNKWR